MALWDELSSARVFDLAQPYFTGMPHFPTHPPFLFGLTKQHGDFVGPAGHSSAADAIALGSHVGTHIDALSQKYRGRAYDQANIRSERVILRIEPAVQYVH